MDAERRICVFFNSLTCTFVSQEGEVMRLRNQSQGLNANCGRWRYMLNREERNITSRGLSAVTAKPISCRMSQMQRPPSSRSPTGVSQLPTSGSHLIGLKLELFCNRRPVGKSILVADIHLCFTIRFYLQSNIFGFLPVWRLLWREDGSVIYSYNCHWVLPPLSPSGLSAAELACIPHCLIWDWVAFLCVVRFTGLRWRYSDPPPHRSDWFRSHFTTDGWSVGKTWCRAPSGTHDQIFVNYLTATVLSYSFALSDERSGLSFVSQV
jgi:hypothetical protein